MKKEEVVVKVGGFTFFVWDVRLVHSYESAPTKDSIAKTYWFEVILKDIPGNVQFKFGSREERDAEIKRVEDLVVAFHEV